MCLYCGDNTVDTAKSPDAAKTTHAYLHIDNISTLIILMIIKITHMHIIIYITYITGN